jgi:hypothetical protein
MASYFYKTKKIETFVFAPMHQVKTASEIYTTLSIINNSDYDVKVIEHDGTGTPDQTEGTLLGSKKMLTYDNPPKNAVYIYGATPAPTTILVKYSE